jgi:hypothetical protein
MTGLCVSKEQQSMTVTACHLRQILDFVSLLVGVSATYPAVHVMHAAAAAAMLAITCLAANAATCTQHVMRLVTSTCVSCCCLCGRAPPAMYMLYSFLAACRW